MGMLATTVRRGGIEEAVVIAGGGDARELVDVNGDGFNAAIDSATAPLVKSDYNNGGGT